MSSCFQALGRPHVTPPASLDALAAFQHARRSAGSSGTARVYSLILFGFELRMLELHMRVLAPQVEKFLVAESTLTFQFGEKPAHLSEALRRGSIAPELAQKLKVDVVSPDELRKVYPRSVLMPCSSSLSLTLESARGDCSAPRSTRV